MRDNDKEVKTEDVALPHVKLPILEGERNKGRFQGVGRDWIWRTTSNDQNRISLSGHVLGGIETTAVHAPLLTPIVGVAIFAISVKLLLVLGG